MEVQPLKCGYRGKIVVGSNFLSLPSGEISILIGNNGSGKSTFIKTLCGVIPALGPSKRTLSGTLLPEELEFPGNLKARDVLRVFDPERGEIAGDLLGIHLNEFYGDLSKGSRQKIKILAAESLAVKQKSNLLCLDEPLSGLDVTTRRTLNLAWRGEGKLGEIFSLYKGHRIISQHSGKLTRHCQIIFIKGGKINILPPRNQIEEVGMD